jgi:hypothetical protein
MRRFLPLLAVPLIVAACGSSEPPELKTAPGAKGCMTATGVCKSAQPIKAGTKVGGAQTFPDIWEGDPYAVAHRPTVIRLSYGDHFYDHHVWTNAARLRAWHVWFGGYVYLTGDGCTAEAAYTVAELGTIGQINGPVIPDAEIPLPSGYVRCFMAYVASHTNYPLREYTGCFSGIERIGRVWVPSYGSFPVCGPLSAWQDSEAAVCGEPWAGDCSLSYGITKAYPRRPHPRPSPQQIARWKRERAALLKRIRDECHPAGPRCHVWMAREHQLWIDIHHH